MRRIESSLNNLTVEELMFFYENGLCEQLSNLEIYTVENGEVLYT